MKKLVFTCATAAFTSAVLSLPSIAQADVITFDNLSGVDLNYPFTYTEAGYTVQIQGGSWFSNTNGNPSPSMALGGIYSDGTIVITHGGDLISFDSLDYSCVGTAASGWMDGATTPFTGFTYYSNLSFPGSTSPAFTTLNSYDRSAKMEWLYIEVGADAATISFDNIRLHTGAVPEPASMAVLSLAVAGLIAIRRVKAA